MEDRNILDEPSEDKKTFGAGNKFNLGEAMLNKKHLNKAREDIKYMKKLFSEVQIYV